MGVKFPLKPDSPCAKDCPRRGAGCGRFCDDWKIYLKARAEFYEKKKAALGAIADAKSVIEVGVKRTKKHGGFGQP